MVVCSHNDEPSSSIYPPTCGSSSLRVVRNGKEDSLYASSPSSFRVVVSADVDKLRSTTSSTPTASLVYPHPHKKCVTFAPETEIHTVDCQYYNTSTLSPTNKDDEFLLHKEDLWYSSEYIASNKKEKSKLRSTVKEEAAKRDYQHLQLETSSACEETQHQHPQQLEFESATISNNDEDDDERITHSISSMTSDTKEQEDLYNNSTFCKLRRRRMKKWSILAVMKEQHRQYINGISDSNEIANVYIHNGAKLCQQYAAMIAQSNYQNKELQPREVDFDTQDDYYCDRNSIHRLRTTSLLTIGGDGRTLLCAPSRNSWPKKKSSKKKKSKTNGTQRTTIPAAERNRIF